MKVKRIEILFDEFDESDGYTYHATSCVFENGLWTFNGPVYGRIIIALHDVWKRLRQEVKN